MHCEHVKLPGGGYAIVCGGHRSGRSATPRCSVRGCSGRVRFECDYPLDGRTCDRLLCATHARTVAPGLDYCPLHFEQLREFSKAEGLDVAPAANREG